MRRPAVILGAISVAVVAGASSGVSAVSEPFATACYSAQFTPFAPRMLSVSDAAGTVVAEVDYPETVCTSVPGSSTAFLVCFHVAKATRPTATPVSPSRAAERFRTLVTSAEATPSSICLAATHTGQPGALLLPKAGIGPYTCYRELRDSVMPTGKNGVVIDDTFGRATVKPVRASRFCAPAAKGRSAPNASKIYLGCYPVVSQIAGANLILATGFGLMRAALGRRDEVCVAAA